MRGQGLPLKMVMPIFTHLTDNLAWLTWHWFRNQKINSKTWRKKKKESLYLSESIFPTPSRQDASIQVKTANCKVRYSPANRCWESVLYRVNGAGYYAYNLFREAGKSILTLSHSLSSLSFCCALLCHYCHSLFSFTLSVSVGSREQGRQRALSWSCST